MNGEYERLILDLEPWLRGTRAFRRVPGAGYLKPLDYEAGANGEAEGEDEDVAADARATVMEKALRVARDIESGQEDPPDSPEPYFKRVMWTALMDWFRAHPKVPGPSPDERAEIDNELFSIGKDEGGEGFSAVPTIHLPTGPRAPAQPRRPALLPLVRHRFWRKPAVSAEYERVQELLNDIPDDRRREAVLLDLQGYRQEKIAARVFKTQQAVSKALREQYAAWGWDDRQVQVTKSVMAYANLVKLFGRVFPDADFVFPLPRRQSFWKDNQPAGHLPGEGFEEEEWESEEERQAALRRQKEHYNVHERSFELPREEEAYNRSQQPILLEDLDLPIEEEREQWKPGPRQESKERRQRQEKLNRLKAQDAKLYRAIMNDPALARWTKNLKLYHMPQLIAWMVGDDYRTLLDDDG